MVSLSHEVLEGNSTDGVVVDKDYNRMAQTDNLLGGPIDDSQLRNTYPGSARSTSISNIRDIDQHDRIQSIGSLNPFTPQSGNSNYYGSNTKTVSKNPTKSTKNSQMVNEMDNPLFTLANSVPMNSHNDVGASDDNDQSQNIISTEWLNQHTPHNSGTHEGNSQLLALQVLAQSIQNDTTDSGMGNDGASPKSTLPQPRSSTTSHGVPPEGISDIALDINEALKSDANIPEGKLFVCDHPGCNKTFSRKMNLMSHYQSTHEHKKPFVCSKCTKAFSRHSDRRRHEKSQHNETSTFTCGGLLDSGSRWGCGKVFKRKDGLTAHWKSGKAKKKCFTGLNDESHRRIESDLAKS